MPKLHHIVGTILKDIAQSRVYSDIYSYEVSVHYEKDSLLRQFPVPRTEVKELELEMKFAFSDKQNEEATQISDSQRLGVFRTQTYNLSRYLMKEVVGNAEKRFAYHPDFKLDEKEFENWEDFKKSLLWKQHENRIQQYILEYFERDLLDNPGDDDKGYDMNVEKAENELTKIISEYLYSISKISELAEKVPNGKETIDLMMKSKLHRELIKIEGEVEFMMNMLGVQSPEVSIMSEKLIDLPPEAISSIKIKTGIRNYTWTKIDEEEDGTPVRKLIPE